MRIGEIDVSTLHGKQHTVTFSHSQIQNESEWTAGSAVPFFDRNHIGFKEWTVTVVVKDSGREAIIEDCSNILALLIGPVDLTLDGFSHHFRGILKNHDRKENAQRRYHMLELTFEGYEYGTPVVVTGSGASQLTVSNPGNLPSPCQIEITPTVGVASIILHGICRDSSTGEDLPVTVSNLETGKTVILDGLTGLITQEGRQKGMDVTIWALPVMQPGENIVTVNSSRMNLRITTIPVYI